MPTTHTVSSGECISSIAERYGFFPDTLWDHADNSALKDKRKDPNILLAGDVVNVPDKRRHDASGATESKHRFRRKGVPEFFRLQLFDEAGEPRKDLTYRLVIDGRARSGSTDAEGRIEEPIPPGASRGELELGEGDDVEKVTLSLGRLDPITEVVGVQQRLNNLGYDCESPSGAINDATRGALKKFQGEHQLDATGEITDETRSKLEEAHGS